MSIKKLTKRLAKLTAQVEEREKLLADRRAALAAEQKAQEEARLKFLYNMAVTELKTEDWRAIGQMQDLQAAHFTRTNLLIY
jgi:hypothetical protein